MQSKELDYEEFFQSESQEEIDKEKDKKQALMSLFPMQLGTVDHTKYVLLNSNKEKQESYNKKTEERNSERNEFPGLENNDNSFNFYVEGNKKQATGNDWLKETDFSGSENKKPEPIVNNNRNHDSIDTGHKPDSLWHDNGHLSVTFRNDILDFEDFDPFDSNDRAGCKRRCVTMLKRAGCELSGERIDMTINNKEGRPMLPSSNFQQGIDAINKALDNKRPIILNVDYKDGTASSADKAGDHFIIVTGKTTIEGVTYYHFYDPATSHTNLGTANSNVLYINDGFLTGVFWRHDGKPNKYKVTSVRNCLNF